MTCDASYRFIFPTGYTAILIYTVCYILQKYEFLLASEIWKLPIINLNYANNTITFFKPLPNDLKVKNFLNNIF